MTSMKMTKALISFISHHAMDGYNNDKNQWTIKTLVGEAVHSDSPEATKEKVSNSTQVTVVAYRFRKRYLQVVYTNGEGYQVEHNIYSNIQTLIQNTPLH